MENSNKEMRTMIGGMDQKLNALVQIMARERNGEREEATQLEKTPILPTPPPHTKLQPEFGTNQCSRVKPPKVFLPNPPRIELPLFAGENPRIWLRKCQKYFITYQIPPEQQMEVVEMFLDNKADVWYQGIKVEFPDLSWQQFANMLSERFAEKGTRDVVEDFNKLQQSGTVEDYQEKFEELKSLMLVKNPHLSESYFVSSFISGLREEIKTMVKNVETKQSVGCDGISSIAGGSLETAAKVC